MDKNGKRSFPMWIFAVLAICGLLASGIFIGILAETHAGLVLPVTFHLADLDGRALRRASLRRLG